MSALLLAVVLSGASPELQLERVGESLERASGQLADGGAKLKADPDNWACATTDTLLFSLNRDLGTLERLKKEGPAGVKQQVPKLHERASALRARAADLLLACLEAVAPELKRTGKLWNLEKVMPTLATHPGRRNPRVVALAKQYGCTYGGGDPPPVSCRP
jgi:hypothetical protein